MPIFSIYSFAKIPTVEHEDFCLISCEVRRKVATNWHHLSDCSKPVILCIWPNKCIEYKWETLDGQVSARCGVSFEPEVSYTSLLYQQFKPKRHAQEIFVFAFKVLLKAGFLFKHPSHKTFILSVRFDKISLISS